MGTSDSYLRRRKLTAIGNGASYDVLILDTIVSVTVSDKELKDSEYGNVKDVRALRWLDG